MFFQPRAATAARSSSQHHQHHHHHHIPWVEKYRPQTLEQVKAQDEVIKMLRKTLQSNNVHLLEILT